MGCAISSTTVMSQIIDESSIMTDQIEVDTEKSLNSINDSIQNGKLMIYSKINFKDDLDLLELEESNEKSSGYRRGASVNQTYISSKKSCLKGGNNSESLIFFELKQKKVRFDTNIQTVINGILFTVNQRKAKHPKKHHQKKIRVNLDNIF